MGKTACGPDSHKGRVDRTQQEQVRKRRHNLFKRLQEFKDRYGIDSWITMQMPSGRVYIMETTDNAAPTQEEIVSLQWDN